MSQDGVGELYEAFERLKRWNKGIFRPAKRKSSFMPSTIEWLPQRWRSGHTTINAVGQGANICNSLVQGESGTDLPEYPVL